MTRSTIGQGREGNRGKRRVVASADSLRQSAFFCVARRNGHNDDWQAIPRKMRETLIQHGAVCVLTTAPDNVPPPEKGEKNYSPVIWLDWYRVPLRGLDVDTLGRIMAGHGIHDGPYYGTGRETFPTGSGSPLGPKHSPGARLAAKRKEVASFEPFPVSIFRDVCGQDARWIDIPMSPHSDNDVPAEWCDLFQVSLWQRLTERYAGFSAVYYHVQKMAIRHGGIWADRQILLDMWIERQPIIVGEEVPEGYAEGDFGPLGPGR